MSADKLPMTVGESDLEEARPVAQSRQAMTQLTTPLDANLLGNVFGGVVLAAVDKIAYVCATRHAGRTTVTAVPTSACAIPTIASAMFVPSFGE